MPCHPKVTLEHKAGCVKITASPVIRWLTDNPLVVSIAMLILGPLVALFGNSHFPLIGAVVGACTMMNVLTLVCAMCGFMNTTTFLWISLIVSLLFSVLFGIFLGKHIKVVVFLNAIVFGWVFGCFLYGIFGYFFAWQSFYGLIGIAIAASVLGGI